MIFDPAFAVRIIMLTLSVTTGVGVTIAGITIGVLVAKESFFVRDTKIVLQSSTTIALNRLIEAYEVPLFYDPIKTMDVFVQNINQVLRNRYGDKFVHVELNSFSSTPNVTSSDHKQSISNERIVRDSGSNQVPQDPQVGSYTSVIPSLNTDSGDTTSIPFNHCTIKVSLVICKNRSQNNAISCPVTNEFIDTCANTAMNVLECVNRTVPVYNCSERRNNMIKCNNATITIPEGCFNGSGSFNGTTASPTTASTTTVSSTTTSGSDCEIPFNATTRTGIISSDMFLYFVVKETESIQVEDIVSALKTLKPLIDLYTACNKSSSQTSSLNRTLSKVEPPAKVNIDLSILRARPSISDSLKEKVSAEAEAARESLFPPTTTAAVG